MERHLGIDFYSIWVDFVRQVGLENQEKIDSRRHRKNNKKKKATEMHFDVRFGTKLGWEMATLCVPKGLQKTSEK